MPKKYKRYHRDIEIYGRRDLSRNAEEKSTTDRTKKRQEAPNYSLRAGL